jgi:hypothetical protein
MTTTTTPFKHRLNEAQMNGIHHAIDQDGIGAGMVTLWRVLCDEEGEPFDSRDSITPGDFAIPGDQVRLICEWMKASCGDGGGVVLFWLQKGPGHYKEDE